MASRQRRQMGYTLMELTIGIGISGLLLVGISATMTIATRIAATPRGMTPTLDRSEFTAHMRRDWQSALVVIPIAGQNYGKGVRCVVPDIDGDLQTDVVDYWWSGQSGTDLYRRVNGQEGGQSWTGVTSLSIAPQRERLTMLVQNMVTSDQGTLSSVPGTVASYYSLSSGQGICRSIDPRRFMIGGERRTSYSIVAVQLNVQAVGVAVAGEVRIYRASDTGWPTGTPIAATVINGSGIDANGSVSLPMDATGLSFTEPICIVIQAEGTTLNVQTVTTTDDGPYALVTHDGGQSWHVPRQTFDVNFKLIGTVDERQSTLQVQRDILKQVEVRVESDKAAAFAFDVSFDNRPEYCAEWIGFHGGHAPTTLDSNLDGAADFSNVSQFSIKDGSLVFAGTLKGHWSEQASDNATAPRIFHARLREFAPFGESRIQLLCESAGDVGVVVVRTTTNSEHRHVTWGTMEGGQDIDVGFKKMETPDLDVRVVILPAYDLASVDLNGVNAATFKYASNATGTGVPATVELTDNGTVGWDEMSLRLLRD